MIIQINNPEDMKSIYKEYLHYMSQFFDIKNFVAWQKKAINNLQKYSNEVDHFIYIFKKYDLIIGFALINKHLRFNNDGLSIAEFYIQKTYERQGYGKQLAEHIFNQFPGNWEVAVTLKNNGARVFWKQVLTDYTSGKFLEKRKSTFKGHGFLFNNA